MNSHTFKHFLSSSFSQIYWAMKSLFFLLFCSYENGPVNCEKRTKKCESVSDTMSSPSLIKIKRRKDMNGLDRLSLRFPFSLPLAGTVPAKDFPAHILTVRERKRKENVCWSQRLIPRITALRSQSVSRWLCTHFKELIRGTPHSLCGPGLWDCAWRYAHIFFSFSSSPGP